MAIKLHRGGKYANDLYGRGYFGSNDAGTPRGPGPGGEPTKREFVGSRMREFTFSDEIHGTHTIVALSYEEAIRIAESLGFTKNDYKKKRRKGSR